MKNAQKKRLRPKGCKRTVSGRHFPELQFPKGSINPGQVICTACGIIDDVGKFNYYLFGLTKKIDDTNL
jgi:hypothetical protein